MKTRAQYCIESLQNRLSNVLISNGCHTNAGLRVTRGRPIFDDENDVFPLINIIDGSEEVKDTKRSNYDNDTTISISYKIVIQGFVQRTEEHPYDSPREFIGDLKKVLFSNDFNDVPFPITLRYENSGIDTVEANDSLIAVQITISFEFIEDLTNPFI